METCRVKKEEEPIIVVATKATNQLQKGQKNNSYVCHICGLNGHKMINCPKFVEEVSYRMSLELEPKPKVGTWDGKMSSPLYTCK